MLVNDCKRWAITQSQTLLIMGIVFLVLFFIIGIPLYNSYKKKQVVAKLKIFYTEIVQANRYYSLARSDEMGIFDTSLSVDDFAERYWVPFLDIRSTCKDEQAPCWNSVQYKDLANNKYLDKIAYTIELRGNMYMGFSKDKDGLISIIVDENGKAGENKLGKDIFVFYVYNSTNVKQLCDKEVYEKKSSIPNGIHFGGYDKCGIPHDSYSYIELANKELVDGCNKKSPKSQNGPGIGAACAALIKAGNWSIDKSYPW